MNSYSEYQKRVNDIYEAQKAASKPAEKAYQRCLDQADKQFGKGTVKYKNAEKACYDTYSKALKSIEKKFKPQRRAVEDEAFKDFIAMPRLIIATPGFSEQITKFRHLDWFQYPQKKVQEKTATQVKVVNTLDELKQFLMGDRSAKQILYLLRFFDKDLVIGNDHVSLTTLKEILILKGVKTKMSDGYFISARVVGDTPTDAKALGEILSQPGVPGFMGFAEWEVLRDWNCYVYVVGTDNRGKGNFCVMRDKLIKDTVVVKPSLVQTFDFREGVLQKEWTPKNGDPWQESFNELSKSFEPVYTGIETIAKFGKISQLHILTHFGDDTVFFQVHGESSVKDLKKHPGMGKAFDSKSVLKIHGCQHNEKIIAPIREFCKTGKDNTNLFKILQTRIEASYPVELSNITGCAVWAAPVGTAAFYNCLYLPEGDWGKVFCIETSDPSQIDKNPKLKILNKHLVSYTNTVKFYEANYSCFFDRLSNEKVFDGTFHMKYKDKVKTNPCNLKPCATALP